MPDQPDLSSVGGRIHFLRLAKGWKQKKLADEVFVTQVAVSHWEAGRFMPGRQSQALLAEKLGTTREFLFGDQEAVA